MKKYIPIIILLVSAFYGCKKTINHIPEYNTETYWFQGLAEVTSYKLEQSRYKEVREGNSILIFVTEELSPTTHIKTDDNSGVKVLKMNKFKKFNTGIYSYSIMQSVFSSYDLDKVSKTFKVATSIQEWCGQTYTQINHSDSGYIVDLKSYYEIEGNVTYTLNKVLLEDEIWNQIRLNPDLLPMGEIKIVPGTIDSRLFYKKQNEEKAQARIDSIGNNLLSYTLNYSELKRSLSITFEQSFPHQIISWKEVHMENGEKQTSEATRIKTMLIDYWNKNSLKDESFRQELELQ